MKYLFLILISVPAFATQIRDNIKSYGQKGDQVSVTFSQNAGVHRMPASVEAVPCLEDAWKARKPVDVEVNDQTGQITNCKLAPNELPGKAGK
jgi:hypothetical protein